MDSKSLIASSLAAGLLIGFLSVIPGVNLLNVLLLGWVWVGSAFSVTLYRRSTGWVRAGDGAILGLLSSLIGVFLVLLLEGDPLGPNGCYFLGFPLVGVAAGSIAGSMLGPTASAMWSSSAGGGEKVLFEYAALGLRVTSQYIQRGASVHFLSGVRWVAIEKLRWPRILSWILMAGGVLGCLGIAGCYYASRYFLEQSVSTPVSEAARGRWSLFTSGLPFVGIIGAVAALVAIVVLRTIRDVWVVRLGLAATEAELFQSRDRALVERVGTALREGIAISSQGEPQLIVSRNMTVIQNPMFSPIGDFQNEK